MLGSDLHFNPGGVYSAWSFGRQKLLLHVGLWLCKYSRSLHPR